MIVTPYMETLPVYMNILEVTEDLGQPLAQKELREIRRAQREDPQIDKWRIAVIDKQIPHKYLTGHDLTMKKQFKNFRIKRGHFISEHY